MILAAPFSGLALGSWISVALALIYSGLILRRVFFEDAFLRKNLEGYDAITPSACATVSSRACSEKERQPS